MTHAPDGLLAFTAQVLAVLANPRRLEIVELLRSREYRVTEMADALELAQAATSQHLAVLRRAGVVDARKDGNFVFYRLAIPNLGPALDAMVKVARDLLVSQEEQLRPILQGTARAFRRTGVGT